MPAVAPAAAQTASPGYNVGTQQLDLAQMPSLTIDDGKIAMTMWQAIEIALRRNY